MASGIVIFNGIDAGVTQEVIPVGDNVEVVVLSGVQPTMTLKIGAATGSIACLAAFYTPGASSVTGAVAAAKTTLTSATDNAILTASTIKATNNSAINAASNSFGQNLSSTNTVNAGMASLGTGVAINDMFATYTTSGNKYVWTACPNDYCIYCIPNPNTDMTLVNMALIAPPGSTAATGGDALTAGSYAFVPGISKIVIVFLRDSSMLYGDAKDYGSGGTGAGNITDVSSTNPILPDVITPVLYTYTGTGVPEIAWYTIG